MRILLVEDGLHFAQEEDYDLAIVLSAKNSVDDKVKGLQVGGNDYLAKPFAFSELLPGSRRSSAGPGQTRKLRS